MLAIFFVNNVIIYMGYDIMWKEFVFHNLNTITDKYVAVQ